MKIKTSILLSLLLLLVLTPSVFAQRATSSGRAEKMEARKEKLTEKRLQACQRKEDAIKKRAESLANLVANMETKFDAIAKRAQDHYTSKVVPSGKTVANYDSLIADIGHKKALVAADLATAQTDISTFTCTGTNPKEQLVKFRTDMQAVKSALKDYRTSIKNLIVAIKSVTGQTQKEK